MNTTKTEETSIPQKILTWIKTIPTNIFTCFRKDPFIVPGVLLIVGVVTFFVFISSVLDKINDLCGISFDNMARTVISGFFTVVAVRVIGKPAIILSGDENSIEDFIQKTQVEFTRFITHYSPNNPQNKRAIKELLEYCTYQYHYVHYHSCNDFSRTWQHLIWLLDKLSNSTSDTDSKIEKTYLTVLSSIMSIYTYFNAYYSKIAQYAKLYYVAICRRMPISDEQVLYITQIASKDEMAKYLTSRNRKNYLRKIAKEFHKLNKKSWKEWKREQNSFSSDEHKDLTER